MHMYRIVWWCMHVCTVHSICADSLPQTDNVFLGGVVLPGQQVKLVDIPELGYRTTNDPPQGELLVKNNAMITGYFKNEEETAKV